METQVVASAEVENLGVQILILHRGWVVVGSVGRRGARLSVTGCRVIRRWGTSNGLGEIALNGPTSSTVLDKSGDLTVLESNVITLMACDAAKWQAVLS